MPSPHPDLVLVRACDVIRRQVWRRSKHKGHTCGARTRAGHPCRMTPQPGSRRCRLHGGLSTGPVTPEGRERIAEVRRR